MTQQMEVGQMVEATMPHSKTCVEWGIAGQRMQFCILNNIWYTAQLYKDGKEFGCPIAHSQIGVTWARDGKLYYDPS